MKEHKTKSFWSSSGECTRFLLSIVKNTQAQPQAQSHSVFFVFVRDLWFVNIDGECELKTKTEREREYMARLCMSVKKRRKCMLLWGERLRYAYECLRVLYFVCKNVDNWNERECELWDKEIQRVCVRMCKRAKEREREKQWKWKKCTKSKPLFPKWTQRGEHMYTENVYNKCTRECDFAMQKQCLQQKQTNERKKVRRK